MQHPLLPPPPRALHRLLEGRASLVLELCSPTSPKTGCSPFVHSTRKSSVTSIKAPSCFPRLGLGEREFPLRAVGEGAAGGPSFRPSLDPTARGPRGPGLRASACARLWALSRAARAASAPTDGPTDRLAAGRTDGVAQKAGKRRDSDMTGHIQQPGGRGNPGPTSSPSPGPGPGPGTSERVALKKEIGLVSACTIIIGERGAHRVESSGGSPCNFFLTGSKKPLEHLLQWLQNTPDPSRNRAWHSDRRSFCPLFPSLSGNLSVEVAARARGGGGGVGGLLAATSPGLISLWGFVKAITLLPSRKRN